MSIGPKSLPRHIVTVEQPSFRRELAIAGLVLAVLLGGEGWIRYRDERAAHEITAAQRDEALANLVGCAMEPVTYVIQANTPREAAEILRRVEHDAMVERAKLLSAEM